jgi:diphthamide biosynthesis protein 4
VEDNRLKIVAVYVLLHVNTIKGERMMMSLYEVLGCHTNATYEELKRRYQELVLKYHPDKQENSLPATFVEIDKAWKILRDPEQRKLYDDQLAHIRLSEKPLIYATLTVSDLDRHEDTLNYSYMCRCGGLYSISQTEVGLEDCFVHCEDCSLIIHIKCDNEK